MKAIILCADDYAYTPAISKAILELIQKNRISATSCMTTTAYWPKAALDLKPYCETIDIGLHLTLTQERAPFIPDSIISPSTSRSTYPHLFFSLHKLLIKSHIRLLKPSEIKAEINRQLDAFEGELGQTPDFIDGHQHVHQLPVIRDMVKDIYNERIRPANKQTYVRLARQKQNFATPKNIILIFTGALAFEKLMIRNNIPYPQEFSGLYNFNTKKNYEQTITNYIKKATHGSLIMSHPGLCTPGTGYSDKISRNRQQEFDYFNSESFLCFLKKHDIILTRYRDLRAETECNKLN